MTQRIDNGEFALVRNLKIRCTPQNVAVHDAAAIDKAYKVIKKSGLSGLLAKESAFVYKMSIDARNKKEIFLVYTIAFPVSGDISSMIKADGVELCSVSEPDFTCTRSDDGKNPVVAGFGPAGMFCALALAKAGLNPVVLERGSDIDTRAQKVDRYWKEGVLDTETNVQFGEGGAGTFSDGKLLTRISDKNCRYVMSTFAKHGAPSEIMYLAKPHIGTDKLRQVVKSIREEIVSLGGRVYFDTRLDDVNTSYDGKVTSVVTNTGLTIPCSALFLCIGHSARDTVTHLLKKGVDVQPKPFSVGVRIEHLRKNIDKSLYGGCAGYPCLGAASYSLSAKFDGRAVYSFCMCPGGVVVASASGEGQIVTNGMSYFARDGVNSNSALAVSVEPSDYGATVEGAIEFQENLERRAFALAGGDGTAPIQLVGDFLCGKAVSEPRSVAPTYTGKTTVACADKVFPKFITDTLAKGLYRFEKEIEGFSCDDAVLTFPETRTSSPVKIPRSAEYLATGYLNMYPCGEGAGYAGGITSAAVDGLNAALKFIKG